MTTLQQLLFHLILAAALLAATAFALLMSIKVLFHLRRWARLLFGDVGSRRFLERTAASRASRSAFKVVR